MKILHINSYYLQRPFHQTMIEHLDKTGIVSEVMAHTSGSEKPVIEPRYNVHVCKCYNTLDKPFFYVKQKKIFDAAQREFDIISYDLVHAYSLFSSGNCAYKIKKRYSVPYVVAIRDTDINVFLKYKPYLKKRGYSILQEASRVFFLSPTYERETIDRMVPKDKQSRFREKCVIMTNGIDDYWLKNINHYRENTDRSFETIKILFVGELSKRKNVISLVKSAELLIEKGYCVELTIIGKIVDEDIYKYINNKTFVSYYSPMKKEELIGFYRGNDLFVLPSLTESFGLVYAEALSQGMPILYTRGQGFDGQYKEGEVGYAIDPRNPEDIANKIIKVIDNYRELSLRSTRNIQKFSWDKITEKYARIYSEIEHEK